jgi:PAS domain S-box-containing protein
MGGDRLSEADEQTRLIEALRQSEDRLRLMIEAVRDYAIFMLDPRGTITSWNLGAERLKGYRADEIIGRHFSIFYLPEDRERGHPEEELRLAKAEGRYEEEGWRVRKDGSRFWANVVITALFNNDGRHLGFTKVTRDFTDAKTLREAQVAIQVRDEFLAIASHELRTPLSAMLMHLESLVRTVRPDGSAPRLAERLKKALATGQRLGMLINQMLDVTRISAGRLQLDPEPTSLREIVAEVVDRFGDDAPITQDVAPGITGVWDRLRLDQVVTNLVTNALKYGEGKPIVIEGRVEGGHAVLRVTDRGIGIPLDRQHRIFDRFERAVTNRQYAGFGLGLWISRQIVEASGGRIEVVSAPGEGATFTVTLPLAVEEATHVRG